MRARNLKPGFFKNEDLAELPFEARLLYEGLWCLADCEGRLEDRPKRIKAEVFPYDEVDVCFMLDRLQEAGFIRRYINGSVENRYIVIHRFRVHQNPHRNEKPSELPAPGDIAKLPDDSSNVSPRARLSSSLNPSSLNPSSLNPESKEEGGGASLPVDNLTSLCVVELPTSESTKEDYRRTIERYRAKMRDDHIERIICELGAWPNAKGKAKLHLTLAAWLNKAPRDALPPAHEEFKPVAEQTPAEREAAKVAAKEAVQRVQALTGRVVGRELPP